MENLSDWIGKYYLDTLPHLTSDQLQNSAWEILYNHVEQETFHLVKMLREYERI